MANPLTDDASPGLSADTLLGGRVTLLQPVTGYRAAITLAKIRKTGSGSRGM